MNKIVYAGTLPPVHAGNTNRCLEIIVPDRSGGVGRVVSGKTELEYGADRICLIPPFTAYTVTRTGGRDLSVRIEQPLVALKTAGVIKDVENDGIRRAAIQAEAFLNCGNPAARLIVAALGGLIAGYINFLCRGEKISPVTERVKNELDLHVSDCTFSVENCLKALPLNYDYIRKRFKKETGATPHEYLLGARMELASGLILSGVSNRFSNYTVSQIAEACGFADPLYFSRAFKKYFGVPPTEYR